MEKINKNKKNNQANTSNSNEDRSDRLCEYCEGTPLEGLALDINVGLDELILLR